MIFGVCAALFMFAVSIPVALVNPALAQLSWILIPVVSWAADRARGRTRGAAA
jgi:hypothetical protein